MQQIFKFFANKLIPVKFTCWFEHKENNYCIFEFKGRVLKSVYSNLLHEGFSVRYVHDIIFCPCCKRPNKITWLEVD